MGLIAELRLTDPRLFQSTFLAVPEARCKFEDFHYVMDVEGIHYVFFWWLHDCDPDTFDAAVDDDQSIQQAKRLAVVENRALYRIETHPIPANDTHLFPFFREHDVIFIEGWQSGDGLELIVRFPDRDTLKAFRQAALEIADRVIVTGLYPERPSETPTRLTDRQRKALTLALERGYFETPRKVTLTDLANELNVTPQTLSRHIRVGVKHAVVDAIGIHRNQ